METEYISIDEFGNRLRYDLEQTKHKRRIDNPLVPLAAAVELAGAIPRARLVVVPGLGHELPPWVWGTLVSQIVAFNAATPEARGLGSPRVG